MTTISRWWRRRTGRGSTRRRLPAEGRGHRCRPRRPSLQASPRLVVDDVNGVVASIGSNSGACRTYAGVAAVQWLSDCPGCVKADPTVLFSNYPDPQRL